MDQILDRYKETIRRHIDSLIKLSTPDNPAWNVEHSSGQDNISGKFVGKKFTKWNYVDGCMISALLSLYNATGQRYILQFCDKFVSHYLDEDGNILGYDKSDFNIDDLNGGRNLVELYNCTLNPKYKLAMDVLYSQLQSQPRTDTKNFVHKGIYPNQVWLDGLYMAQVFYAQYTKQFENCAGYDDIFNQFSNVRQLMFDSKAGLYYHGLDSTKSIFWADKTTGLSQSFWLRSNGWLLCALVDVIEVVGVEHVKVRSLVNQLNELLDGILKYLDQGMLCQVVDKPNVAGNYHETSGSAMVAYAALKAHRLGLRANGCSEGASIFNAICDKYLKVVDDKLALGGICLVAGLGPDGNFRRDGTFEYYISEPVVQDDAKGVMPFVLAFVELLRQQSLGH